MAKITSLILNKINELFNIGIFYVFPRPSTRFIRDRFKNKTLIGAEIGVAGGHNARSMLKTLNLSRLYLIDPYTLYGNDYLDGMSKRNKEMSKRFTNYENTVFFYLDSSMAAKKIKEQLDFVYIDGNHDYSFVKKDIENYYPLLKMGGVLAGHDINNFGFENGVLKAVMEFAVKNNLYVYNYHNDWWIVKIDKTREKDRKVWLP